MTTNLRVRNVPRLCELNPGICLTTEAKARKNLSQGSVLQYNITYSAVKLHVPTQIMKCCHLYGYEAGKRFL